VCCSALQYVAVCCSALQCVAVCCSVFVRDSGHLEQSQEVCVAGCCRVLHGVAWWCKVLQVVAGCCSVVQCVAACFSALQCVAVSYLLCAGMCCSVFVSYSGYGVATISRLLK